MVTPSIVRAFAIGQFVPAAGGILAIARLHDGNGVGCRQHRAMTGARMVGMAMRDDGPNLRLRRIDVDAVGRDAQIAGEEGLGHG